jgi:hypothetical protein
MELWWQVFAWAVGVVTFFFLAQRESHVRSIPAALGLVLLKLVVAVGVIGFGYGLEPALWSGIQGGVDKGLGQLAELLGGDALGLFASGLIPGGVALLVATVAPNRTSAVQRAVITAILCLALTDVVWSVLTVRPLETLVFSLFSDVLGGALAGAFIGWLAGWRQLSADQLAAPSGGDSAPVRG